MFFMCIDMRVRWYMGEYIISSMLLTEVAFLQGRIRYILYVYSQRLRCYTGE